MATQRGNPPSRPAAGFARAACLAYVLAALPAARAWAQSAGAPGPAPRAGPGYAAHVYSVEWMAAAADRIVIGKLIDVRADPEWPGPDQCLATIEVTEVIKGLGSPPLDDPDADERLGFRPGPFGLPEPERLVCRLDGMFEVTSARGKRDFGEPCLLFLVDGWRQAAPTSRPTAVPAGLSRCRYGLLPGTLPAVVRQSFNGGGPPMFWSSRYRMDGSDDVSVADVWAAAAYPPPPGGPRPIVYSVPPDAALAGRFGPTTDVRLFVPNDGRALDMALGWVARGERFAAADEVLDQIDPRLWRDRYADAVRPQLADGAVAHTGAGKARAAHYPRRLAAYEALRRRGMAADRPVVDAPADAWRPVGPPAIAVATFGLLAVLAAGLLPRGGGGRAWRVGAAVRRGLAVGCLLAGAGVLFAAVGDWRRVVEVTFRFRGERVWLTRVGGRFQWDRSAGWVDGPADPPPARSSAGWTAYDIDGPLAGRWLDEPQTVTARAGRLGASRVAGRMVDGSGTGTSPFVRTSAPAGPIAGGLQAVPAAAVAGRCIRRLRDRRRRRGGWCDACGYDLRGGGPAGHARCPECGAAGVTRVPRRHPPASADGDGGSPRPAGRAGRRRSRHPDAEVA